MDYTQLAPYVPFTFILAVVALILIRAHISAPAVSPFSIFDLIQDKETGRGSLEKVGMLVAMLTLTWWFINMAVLGKATWEEAIAYGGILGLSKFANSWLSTKASKT